MRPATRVTTGVLIAMALQTPLILGAQQQIAPAPPPPAAVPPRPEAIPPRPAMVPELKAPIRIDTTGVMQQIMPREVAPRQVLPKQIMPQQITPDKGAIPGTQPVPTVSCPKELLEQCRAADAAGILYTRMYYESLIGDLELRRRAFEWHEFSTKVLFWSVIAITGLGLVLSWREFGKYYNKSGARNARPPASGEGAPAQPGAEAPPQSVFKVSAQGLEVTSSLIGFLVLAVSLAFFYLYVVNVYPLYELSGSDKSPASAQAGGGTKK